MSTNSDPNDGSTSLLQRIKNNNAAASTPTDGASASFQFGSRPPTGSLRVDTTALDGPSISKQNKSAYPTFASNGILLPAPEPIRPKSPAPVTAGPDLGRYNAAARLEIVGLNGVSYFLSKRVSETIADLTPPPFFSATGTEKGTRHWKPSPLD